MKSEKLENIAIALTAMGTVAVTGALTLSFAWLLMGVATQIFTPVAFAQTRPAVELEAAIAKEQVDGDLKTAMAAFQRIAANNSASRDVRSKALLHLAGCYEKQGQQAQNVYQQIVRDFADQPSATQARARLAVLQQVDRPAAPATMTQRKIETFKMNFHSSDTDGRQAVYYHDDTPGELIYGDLAGRNKRVVFKAKADEVPGWIPSRDFSTVLLVFPAKPGQPPIYAVINIDGTGYREIARPQQEIRYWNWSWDNRSILLCARQQDGSGSIVRLSADGAQSRDLVRLEHAACTHTAFSPDGRFVAYGATGDHAGVYVLPVESGSPRLVSEQADLLDWTRDGRYLAITSKRSGKMALYLLPVKDGQPTGEPVFIRYGTFQDGYTTASGALIYNSMEAATAQVHVASLDPHGRPDAWQRLDLLGEVANTPFPKWARDSIQMTYLSQGDVGPVRGEVVRLRNLSNGQDHEVYRSAPGNFGCTMAAQQPKLFCFDYSGDVFSIATDSGEVERIHSFTAPGTMVVRSSSDDRGLYIDRPDRTGGTGAVLRWDIASGRETILEQYPKDTGWILVSPDERWLVRRMKQNLDVRPMSGGDWRSLVSLNVVIPKNGFGYGQFAITPDGNWVLYHDTDSAGNHSLFRVATAGGLPERLGEFPTNVVGGTIEISPDGRRVIATSVLDDNRLYELWSLENFVAPAPKQ